MNRFFVALAAVIVTVGVGYLTFVRRTPMASSTPAARRMPGEGALVDRVAALERRLGALCRAFTD